MRQPTPTVFALLLLASTARAQDFELTLDSAASQADVEAAFAAVLPGSVIGDYDPVSNPGGTRTVPGLFGGSGNQPIGMDLVLNGSSLLAGAPSGSLGVSLDLDSSALAVEGLALDLLGGGSGTSDLVLTLLYSTFRTFQPDSLYLGGIPLDLPLGTQTLGHVTLAQSGPSSGGLVVPTSRPDTYTFAVAVPVDLAFEIDFGGTITPVGPLPLVVPLGGTLVVGAQSLSWSATLDLVTSDVIQDPVPDFSIDGAPFDVPTILPPGSTAHLLLSAVVASVQLDLDLSLELVAGGPLACGFEPYCDAIANSSGIPARLTASGSASVADEDLTLDVVGLPTDEFGYFLMSQASAYVPGFGSSEGILCVGPPQLRFSMDVLSSGATGAVSFAPDFHALPQGVTFEPGSTWHFQLWFRDGTSSNTSDGARVRFCP